MAKTKVSEWDSNASGNTDINGININEGCPPSTLNNMGRELMSQIKNMITGSDGDNFVVGNNLTVNGTTTLTGNATAPTQTSTDNSTKIATTAYVQTKTAALGTMSTQNANAVAITGGTLAGVTVGGLTVGSNATGSKTISTASPTGGSDGDIWYKV
tara:strand:+ start:182 stop:652 length:471 start_codon:yes stop_codon:yes gene_type:complete